MFQATLLPCHPRLWVPHSNEGESLRRFPALKKRKVWILLI
jgi:hypothetical protein